MMPTAQEPIPGGAVTPAGEICVPCQMGKVEVETRSLAVCWDTGPDGVDATDRPLGGVTVRLVDFNGSATNPKVSGTGPVAEGGDGNPQGKVTFHGLQPGEYQVRATKRGATPEDTFDGPITHPKVIVRAQQKVTVGVALKRRGLECDRKHPNSKGKDDGPTIWLPVLWVFWGEPVVLWLRDLFWLTTVLLTVVGLLSGDLSLSSYSAAVMGMTSVIIFGPGFGGLLLVGAFAMFAGLCMVVMGSSLTGMLGGPTFHFLLVGMVVANWIGFVIGLVAGRREPYEKLSVLDFALWPAVVGAVASGLVVGLLGHGFWWIVLAIVLGDLAATLSAILGHIFVNEGRTLATSFQNGFLLPFTGTRYCVQGVRGMISHADWQEFAYDFAVPEGTPVLSAKEGHLVAWKEDRDGTDAFDDNPIPNLVRVRHRDGSSAEYLHGKQHGVTSVNPDLATMSTASGAGDLAENRCSVYVQAGQHLCEAGNVGISMFSHIHFVVTPAPTPADRNPDPMPIAFDDADVQSHEGRCRSMRKYRSDNRNRDAVVLGPRATSGYR